MHREHLTLANIDQLDFGKGAGLVPAIVQDANSGAVLMLGYMTGAALRASLERGRVVFFSRSKERLWEKGETSGNYLELLQAHLDCDQDALLITARAKGPICHLGTRSCFGDVSATAAERVAFLSELEAVIESRRAKSPETSYTARLLSQGAQRVAQKVGEEALELAIAAIGKADEEVVAEAADLMYHMLVLLQSRDLNLGRVVSELAARHAKRLLP